MGDVIMVLTANIESDAGRAVQENPTTGGTPTKEPSVFGASNDEQLAAVSARDPSSCEARDDSVDSSDSDSDSDFVLPPDWWSTAGLMPSFFRTREERRLEKKLVKQQKKADRKEERRKKAEAEKRKEELLRTVIRCYPGTFGAPKRPRN